MADPTVADDPHLERCDTVGELRDALADFAADRPLGVDHGNVEFENVIVDDEGDRVMIY